MSSIRHINYALYIAEQTADLNIKDIEFGDCMATIRELLGNSFKEGMTFEELEQALEGKKLADLSSGEYVSKNKLADYENRAKNAEKKLAEHLTEEEKKAQTIAERENHYKELEHENAIYKYKAELSTSISDQNVVDKIANLYADGKFQDGIKAQLAYFNVEKSNLEKQIKADLLKNQPTPAPQNISDTNTVTAEQFNKMSYQERVELKKANPELFEKLNN